MRLAVLVLAVWACSATAASLLPPIERATRGEHCVEPASVMRREHMNLLRHQRDETVHGGIRGAKYSLKDCVACHASAKTGSVAAGDGDFCVSCHRYAAVQVDCFECHTGKPPTVAAKVP
jgi:hypothetical protein